ncbi:MAG TPA: anti-sigma F factor [Methylomusa anaerophila]|uniref:Anti-sigma F factor n=1 Tax=Methylomusa anaerophila TaxID=1930071 RepID=A0A348APE4_9FIRM|nr:anti-sigma F factor [Methylomusa anaerophila]BBB92942.1 anti-sigma F factor [Methylomusa anaerophila]HML87224.1 anti-sigma F factor [Methylomusa anaerophila]
MSTQAPTNQVKLSVLSLSENVGFARLSAAAFASQAELTINEIEEIKVAVSEAVSNAVIHGYGKLNQKQDNYVEIVMTLYQDRIDFVISDYGRGIADVEAARQPSYSSDPERMGLGFVFMESFMDSLAVVSTLGQGTTVTMSKKFTAKTSH